MDKYVVSSLIYILDLCEVISNFVGIWVETMVFFFTASSGHTFYMGKDKYENEDLIKYGLPEDVWFHVEDLSSAHVYLRLNEGEKLEDISEDVIMEACQLVKANSIEGCKQASVGVNYTRWRNLQKLPSMEVGAIGFHDRSKVKKLRIEKDKEIVKVLNKTKTEDHPDLAKLQADRARRFKEQQKEVKKKEFLAEKQSKKDRQAEAELRSYSSVFKSTEGVKNTDMVSSATSEAAVSFEDDFM